MYLASQHHHDHDHHHDNDDNQECTWPPSCGSPASPSSCSGAEQEVEPQVSPQPDLDHHVQEKDIHVLDENIKCWCWMTMISWCDSTDYFWPKYESMLARKSECLPRQLYSCWPQLGMLTSTQARNLDVYLCCLGYENWQKKYLWQNFTCTLEKADLHTDICKRDLYSHKYSLVFTQIQSCFNKYNLVLTNIILYSHKYTANAWHCLTKKNSLKAKI